MEDINLNRADIEAVVQIIDVVSERGAFKGGELASVGAVRQKYAAFLDSIDKASQQAQEEAANQGPEEAEVIEE